MGGRFGAAALWVSLCLAAGSCASEGTSSEATTSGSAASATSAASTTSAPATTEDDTTTEAPTTSEAALDEATPEEIGNFVLLEEADFAGDWSTGPRTDETIDFSTVTDCEFVGDLIDDDGSLTEVTSAEFSQGDLSVTHDVRIYADVGAATDVVLAWAEESTSDCVVAGLQQELQASFDAGELAPFENVDINLQQFDDHVGEPRVTNLELSNTYTGPDQELVVVQDQYFVQVGRAISLISVFSPAEPWAGTSDILEVVSARMAVALGDG